MQGKGDIIVGLDIGTTKICAVVGELSGKDINIIGIGTHPSIGLRKGVVVNIESTVESIKKAVDAKFRRFTQVLPAAISPDSTAMGLSPSKDRKSPSRMWNG